MLPPLRHPPAVASLEAALPVVAVAQAVDPSAVGKRACDDIASV